MSNVKKKTTEELLKQLEDSQSSGFSVSEQKLELEDSELFHNDVYQFISDFGLEAGKHKVGVALLFNLYRIWNPNKPKGRAAFSLALGHIIPKPRLSASYVLLNKKGLTLAQAHTKIINEKGKAKSPTVHLKLKEHFQAFLDHYTLAPGSYRIESFVLYHLYKTWNFTTKKARHVSYWQFVQIAKVYLKSKVTHHSAPQSFFVNLKLLDLVSESTYRNLRQANIADYDSNQKEKSKTERKISQSKA